MSDLSIMPFCEVSDSIDASQSQRRFGSLARALGDLALARLENSHVVVAGIGGVGSWAAEALARSAVGHLTLIDLDHVAESNINRQVHALDGTLGLAKVQAMADRIAQINPHCQVDLIDDFVTPENVSTVIPAHADVVLDCTDQMAAKVAMVCLARERSQALLVCGAAGGKTDTTTLQVSDLNITTHDKLLARLRQQLRKHHGYAPAVSVSHKPSARQRTSKPKPMGVPVLWLSQPSLTPAQGMQGGAPLACAGYGSLVTVTAAMGLAAAGWAIEQVIQKQDL